MNPAIILPSVTTILSFVFAAMVFDQWLRRRQPYQLVWTVGLVWYGLGAGIEAIGGAQGWSEALYRGWYMFGAFGVASSLGLGTIYLLSRTRFGYFVAFSFGAAALFSYLTAVKYAREGTPPADLMVILVVGACAVAAVVVALATRLARGWVGHVAAVALVVGWTAAAFMALTVEVAPPGYALAANGAPIGTAMPADLRILTPPFNIVGAFALVFGAVLSAYIFMPKTRVMRVTTDLPLVGAVGRGIAVGVNFVASIPAAWRALRAGTLNSRVPATILIALGGFIPGWTDALARFGLTAAFFIGQLVGVLLIFLGFLVSIEVFSDVRLPFTRIVLRRRTEAAPSEEPAPDRHERLAAPDAGR
ncbi:MAG: hypothetical protein IT341_08445 [Chloroflexi bacterium]|nr:hypothetical protein [Chloroflexota bacterium]